MALFVVLLAWMWGNIGLFYVIHRKLLILLVLVGLRGVVERFPYTIGYYYAYLLLYR